MKPVEFVQMVQRIAKEEDFPLDLILLGGDHLGTNAWRDRPAEAALAEAKTLVRDYAAAGYKKIHLDASFICADDNGAISDETAARRCVEMVKVCEAHCGEEPPIYVVGTEVPTPGGAVGDEELHATGSGDVETTLSVFKDVFLKNDLGAAWERVAALVVQPGVEFGDDAVYEFSPVPELAATILNYEGMVYEAHSTDYQTAENLNLMVRDHFYILKVGPWLTFALREGLYLLEMMEKEMNLPTPSCFRDTLGKVMRSNPEHWKRYYSGSQEETAFKMNFSYSDRARYYLGHEEVLARQERLLNNLNSNIPESLVSQYMPSQYSRLRSGNLGKDAMNLAVDRVSNVLDFYMAAGS